MIKLLALLSLTFPLAPTVGAIYTGFNYGAFWGVDSNAKRAADFQAGFSYAHNLTSNVPFNSARLYTCKTQGTVDEPTEAFDAAINTKTNLLLGFWITPAKRGGPLDDIIKNELSALEKGFQKHGQALADLVIGLSVGSEDIYRWEDTEEAGVAATEVSATIHKVKDAIASSSFATYMKDKPVGHVDTAKHAVVDGADFFGMTAYPYWNKDSIDKGRESFAATLNNLKKRAGNTLIWIAEMGWPYEGASQGDAIASAENLQQYWNDVGCQVVGEYTTFWFELIKDSEANQPDWGVLDPVTHRPRINFRCAGEQPNILGAPENGSSIYPSARSSNALVPTTLATLLSHSMASGPSVTAAQPLVPVSLPALSVRSTTHITTTVTVTVQAPGAPAHSEVGDSTITTTVTATISSTSSAPTYKPTSVGIGVNYTDITAAASSPASGASILPSEVPWCVTMADVAWNGQYVPVAGGPAGPDGKCSSPPTYTGLPYGLGQPTAPVAPSATHALSTLVSFSTVASGMSSAVPSLGSMCHPYCTSKPESPIASFPASPSPPAVPISAHSNSIVAAPQSPTAPVPSSVVVPVPPSSPAPVASSPAISTPSSSAALVIPSPATSPPPSTVAAAPSDSAKHSYCDRKSSLLAGSAAASASPKPADVVLPHLSFPSGKSAKREVVKGEKTRWVWWW